MDLYVLAANVPVAQGCSCQGESSSYGCWAFERRSGKLKYVVNLSAGNLGKPFNKFVDRCASIKVLKKRAHRKASARKAPIPAELGRISVNGFA